MTDTPTTQAVELYGPQSDQIEALIERAKTLTYDEATKLAAALDAARAAALAAALDAALDAARAAALAAALDAALDAARDAAWDAARDAAWDAARDAAWDAARDAAWDAAWAAARDAAWAAAWAAVALVVRDLISTEQYNVITGPWRTVIGPIHPDDAPLDAA